MPKSHFPQTDKQDACDQYSASENRASTAMFSYKFAPYPQKNDTNQGFSNSHKRSNFDVASNASLTGNTQKMASDSGFPLSLSSRRAESQAPGSSAQVYQASDVANSKLLISVPGISSRLKSDELGGIGLQSRTFATSTPSSRGHPQRFAEANILGPEPNPSEVDPDTEPEEIISLVNIKISKLKKENVKQHKHIKDLEMRLAGKDRENATLSRDLVQMEAAHKKAINKHRDALDKVSKIHASFKSELDGLRPSESSLLIISEAKGATEEWATWRDSIQTRLRDLGTMFDNDGRFVLTAEFRETIHELRSELSKTQQVADLLRDKLHTMGTELAEARARVFELEELITADRNHSGSTAAHVRESAEQLAQVTRYLEEQKSELMQALMNAYEIEQQFVQAQTQLQEAQSMITSMKEEMTAREEFQEEQEAKLRANRHAIDFQEGNVKDLEARTRASEERLVQALNHSHELQGRLDAAKTLEKSLTEQVSRLLLERDEAMEELKSHNAVVQASEKDRYSELAKVLAERDVLVDRLKLLEGVKHEVETYRQKYAECQVSVKVLQERYDDQCVTLAASKESIGELQERLQVVERQATETTDQLKREIIRFQEQNASLITRLESADKEIRQAAEMTSESKRETTRYQEQNASLKTRLERADKEICQAAEMANESRRELQEQDTLLKTRLERADKEIGDKTAALQALQIELSRQEGTFKVLLETERLSKSDALGQLQGTNGKVESLLTELSQKDHHRQELAERLAAAEALSAERDREVVALNLRIAELEESEKRVAGREASLCHRYRINDLNDNERAFVTLLVEEGRALHSREIVDKSNEIKRRDNIIKQHEARIEQLGNALARRINNEGGERRPGVPANPNTQKWTASAKGNDAPGNEIAVDATKPQSSDHPPETRGAGHAATTHNTSDPPLPGPSGRSTGHAAFSKLCREDSDDIASFDEAPPVATGKRAVMFAEGVEDEALRPARRAKHGKGANADKYDGDQAKKRTTKRR